MTYIRIAIAGTAVVMASSAACTSEGGWAGPRWGAGGVAGNRYRGSAAGECPDVGANPSFACPPGSTAIACDLPFESGELRVSNDHLYLVVGTELHRARDTGLERLLDLRIGPENHGHSSLQVEEPYVYLAEANQALPPDMPPPKQPIFRRQLDGSDDLGVVWDCSDWTSNFIIDGDAIFSHSANGVLRIDKAPAGSRATLLLPSGFRLGWALAADDSGVYWGSVEGLVRSEKTSACACACAACPAAGGSTGAAGSGGAAPRCAIRSQLLSEPLLVGRLVLEGPWVYFGSSGDVFRLAKTGGTPESLVQSTAGPTRWLVQDLAANATDIYVAALAEGRREQHLLRIPRGGREFSMLPGARLAGDDFGPVMDMAATADAVYRLISTRCGAELQRHPIDAEAGRSR
jgi:hypothetical protein